MAFVIAAALKQATQKLPSFEAEVLLAALLQTSRAHLHAWPEKTLTSAQYETFLEWVKRREQGEPAAYIIGYREFWSMDLRITPDVLVPRPETELLVQCALDLIAEQDAHVADLGTGSGAIALALAKERPNWKLWATDKDKNALQLASENAKTHQIHNIVYCLGNWCHALPEKKFHAIVSNPPYLAEDDEHLKRDGLWYEPRHALVAGDGLRDLEEIILSARNYLLPEGKVLLEHGCQQAKKVADLFAKAGYTSINSYQDIAKLDRVTIATWAGF